MPPPRQVLPGPPAAADDRRGLDAARAPDRGARADDRVAALRNYRRARGLCFTCGERWGAGHQCAATVQLHVVEELLELLQAEQYEQPLQQDGADEEVLMSISKLATTGQTTPRTVRLIGKVADVEVLILVDSGSSHSFISEAIAGRLTDQVQQVPPTSVKIADGGVLICSGVIPACAWQSQGHTFLSDLRVLPLGCYDMVVGMDWLEQCGPMWIDWVAKRLQFQHQGQTILLTGVQSVTSKVDPISFDQLQMLEHNNSVAHVVVLSVLEDRESDQTEQTGVPVEVEELLSRFHLVFEEPQGLPPHRPWDHKIPLIPGAKPVNIRPYRYTPEQKSEIEQQ